MILKFIDNQLNQITMYRLVIYLLVVLSIYALALSAFGFLYLDVVSLTGSFILVSLVAFVTNYSLAKIFGAPSNTESTAITALILFLIMIPGFNVESYIALGLTTIIAIASKYIFAINKKHIFNPVAVGAVVISLLGLSSALWWVGSSIMLPAVIVASFLIVRKLRRFQMFFATILTSCLVIIVLAMSRGVGFGELLTQHFLSWPIIFFASVMVTEPLSTPPTKRWQLVYGGLIGAVSSIPFTIGSVHNTPELTLLAANLLSYSVSLKRRLILPFVNKSEIANATYELSFQNPKPFKFKAGQYLEWTLPHDKVDSRGIRRYFTIASSPTETDLKLGVKSAPELSSFKYKLFSLTSGDILIAGQISGDFVLPDDVHKKLLFIAGGIGVTPFRSMIKYLIDMKERRDIVMYYCNKTDADVAYRDIFTLAEQNVGLKTHYIATTTNPFTMDTIIQNSPDYLERTFYISGPAGMVDAYKKMLTNAGVSRRNIITDYFPGLA